jgi:hypothetical protein
MSWWVPLAFIAAGVVGIALAYSLTAGRPRTSSPLAEPAPEHGRRKSRFEQDNELTWNRGAFVAVALLVAFFVGLAILIEAV